MNVKKANEYYALGEVFREESEYDKINNVYIETINRYSKTIDAFAKRLKEIEDELNNVPNVIKEMDDYIKELRRENSNEKNSLAEQLISTRDSLAAGTPKKLRKDIKSLKSFCAASYVHRGTAYRNIGQYNMAKADFEEALRLDPKNEKAIADFA